MKPDTTYQLHPDDDNKTSLGGASAEGQGVTRPEAPSKYNQPQPAAAAEPATVPWYLRPLTKTTNDPLTSSQTRPYVPRQPAPMAPQPSRSSDDQPDMTQPVSSAPTPPASPINETNQQVPADTLQAPPLSPFRSQPLTGASVPPIVPQSGQYQTPRPPLQSPYKRPAADGAPKPFSQFAAPSTQPADQASPPKEAKKPKKLRPIILIGLGLLLVAGIIFGLLAVWRNSTSQPAVKPPVAAVSADEKLYKAIESHFSTSKLHQVFDQTTKGEGTSTLKIDATGDFSDPAKPKSAIKYELTSGEGNSASQGAGELVILDTGDYYGKLTKPVLLYQGDEKAKPKEQQWYVIPAADASGAALLDPLSVRTSINTSQGEIPIGNFSAAKRQELMDFIRGRHLYKVKSSDDATVAGKKTTHYKVDFDVDGINQLNAKVAEATGATSETGAITFTKNDTRTMEIWVDQGTNRIVRVKLERESKAAQQNTAVKESTNLVIDYPNDVSVVKPDDVAAGTWTANR